MRLRQAKKIMVWCKGYGDNYTIHRSKDNRLSFYRKCERLRPMYYDIERKVWVIPTFYEIEIIRRAQTRLFRWLRKGNNPNKYKYEEKN